MWKTRFLVCLSVIRVLIKYSLSTRVLGAHCESNTRFQKNIWVCITITNGGEIKIPCHQQRAPPSKEKNARLLPPLQQSAELGLAENLFGFLKRLIWHLTICWAGPGWKMLVFSFCFANIDHILYVTICWAGFSFSHVGRQFQIFPTFLSAVSKCVQQRPAFD